MKRLTFGKLIIGTGTLVLLTCIVFAVTVVARFLWPYLGGDSLETQISKLKASGEPVTMAELVGPAIPDSQNAALIYEKAFKEMGFPKDKSQFEERVESLLDDWKSGKTNAYPKLEQFVSQYQTVIPLIEKASDYPKCRFSVNWEDGLDAKLDHLGYLRCLSTLLSCATIVEAHNGRIENADHLCELKLKLSNAVQGEPDIISFLTRTSLIRSACSSIRASLEFGNMTNTQARRLYDALSAIELNAHHKRALQGQRIQGIGFYKQIASGRIGSTKISDASTKHRFVMGAFLRPDQAYFFKEMKREIDCANVPYRVLKARKTDETIECNMPSLALVSMIFVSGFGYNAAQDWAVADINGSQIALAMRVFHNATSSYPQSLSKLKTEPGWKLNMQDPFSGKDFIYKRKGKGYLLYSIGRNLKDEGGWDDFTPAQRAMHPRPDMPDDIVWKMEH
ncbi:MAG: hypothetical protein NT018_10535 [Armatimonadetes bacterium]|nr:hypothetical protein [Armatimonadota bacterium]